MSNATVGIVERPLQRTWMFLQKNASAGLQLAVPARANTAVTDSGAASAGPFIQSKAMKSGNAPRFMASKMAASMFVIAAVTAARAGAGVATKLGIVGILLGGEDFDLRQVRLEMRAAHLGP